MAAEKAWFIFIKIQDHHNSVSLVKRHHYRIVESFVCDLAYNKFINYKFNIMSLVPVKLHPCYKFTNLSIYADTHEPFSSQLFKQLLIMALSSLYYG